MKKGSKKVLVITYYFPPSGGSGVQRTLKFVKYLREFDWEPVILTARDADYPAYDESLWADVPPNMKIYSARILEPYKLYRCFTGKSGIGFTDVEIQSLNETTRRRWSERVSEWIRATFFIPDARVSWLFFAVPLGLRVVRRERISMLYSSAPPYTTHLIALALKRLTHLPWVADFRDSWIGWHSAPQWRPPPSRRVELTLEDRVLQSADRILVVSSGVKNDLLSRHGEYADSRWQILPNGYDETDFADTIPHPQDEKLTITYTGSFFGDFSPEYLLQALEALCQEDESVRQKIRLRFVGRIATTILDRIHRSSVRPAIEIVPYVPHKKGLSYLLGTDFSFLMIDDAPIHRGILTGKLFEYIGAGKPILALVPEDGDAAELIRRNHLGIVVPPRDVDAIKRMLVEILEKKQSGTPFAIADEGVKRNFTRRNLTSKLAMILNQIHSPNRQQFRY